jgi:predicted SprT family Zn-dependent metalloprotease
MTDLFKQDHPTVRRPYRCRCGSDQFYLEHEKPPHGHHLRCANCGAGGFWMKKTEPVARQGETPHAR